MGNALDTCCSDRQNKHLPPPTTEEREVSIVANGDTRTTAEQVAASAVPRDTRAARSLEGHKAFVNSVATSRDGRFIASGSSDTTCRVWDATRGVSLFSVEHYDAIRSLCFSSDDKWIATCSMDGSIKVWDVVSGELLLKLLDETDKEPMYAIDFSPNNKLIACARVDKSVKVWEISSKRVLIKLMGHDKYVSDLKFSPNGKQLATGGQDNSIGLWDTETFARQRKIQMEGREAVLSLSYSPDSAMLASGGSDKFVRIFNSQNGQLVRSLEGHTGGVYAVCFAPNGKQIASGGSDQTVRIWDTRDPNPQAWKIVQTSRYHKHTVFSVAINVHGHVISGSADRTVRIAT